MISAQNLLTHGFALVPIPLKEKGPKNHGWNARQNVFLDPQQANTLMGINIGIAHAYCSPTPTCAIDIDDYKEACKWLSSKNIDLNALLLAQDSVVIHSGKRNSLKLLYRLPTAIGLPSKQIKTAMNSMMLEFRCATADGLTVQDLLPPSMHPSGTQYKYVGSGSILALPKIPQALLAIWQNLLIKQNHITIDQNTKNLIGSKPPETPRSVSELKAKLNLISADCCYDIWRNVVWAILSTRWTYAEQLAKNWSMSAPHRFDEEVFDDLVNSYDPTHEDSPTLGTVYYLAKQGALSHE